MADESTHPVDGDGVASPSRSYRLTREESPAAGIRRIALGRTEKALDELAAATEGDLASSIHGARKNLKKLRAVSRLVREELGAKRFKAEDRRYRDAARLLSRSRDAEVKLETLVALRARFGGDFPREGAESWKAALQRERAEIAGAERGETARRIERAAQAIEQGREGILAWPLRTDSWQLVEAGLLQSYRRGRQAMESTLASPDAERVHAWRKRTKDLWYQLRIVQGAWPSLLGETADQVGELADLLGEHHDLAMLAGDLADREVAAARGELRSLIARRQEELLAAALDLGERIYAEKPKAFRRRLEAYWSAWRQQGPEFSRSTSPG
jgi:CHAD domain-containing protein